MCVCVCVCVRVCVCVCVCAVHTVIPYTFVLISLPQDELELLRREICSGALLRCPDGLDPLLQCRRPPSSVRILIVGSYGTGKSAYINSVYKALYSAQLMPAYTQDPSAEGTFFLDEYIANDASPVSFLDMRGQYEWFDETEIREIRNIVLGFIRPGTCLLRGVELQMLTDEELTALKDGSSVLGKADRIERLRAEDVPVSDQVHGVIFTFAKYETPLRSPENPRFLELLDEIAPLRDFIKDNGETTYHNIVQSTSRTLNTQNSSKHRGVRLILQ